MKWLVALLAPHAAATTPADPAALIAPATTPAAEAARATAPRPRASDPLDAAADALECAVASGADARAAAAFMLEALAYSDFSALELNGPHTRAGDRVSRKALKKAQRVLLAVAERGALL